MNNSELNQWNGLCRKAAVKVPIFIFSLEEDVFFFFTDQND
jgi:hypothetical protein